MERAFQNLKSPEVCSQACRFGAAKKAHEKYHVIHSMQTKSDVGDAELLHAPVWFAKYDHKGNKIVLAVDANSGRVINSIDL